MFDITSGAGAASIAMDVAAIAIPSVPNPKLLKFIKPQTIRKLVNGVEKEFELTRSTTLARAEFVEQKYAAGNNRLKLTLKYKGRRSMIPGDNYSKHFAGFSWSEGDIARYTKNNPKKSLWMPQIDDDTVQARINEALRSYAERYPHPRLDTLDGYVYDLAVPGSRNDPILYRLTRAGYAEGKCTSKIKLSVNVNGDIHAYPTLR